MVIRDKAELKRRVRTLVKKTGAADVFAPVDWTQGAWGVDAMLRTWMAEPDADEDALLERFQERCVQRLPLEPRAAESFAALSAMDMPLMDLAIVREREKLLGRDGYCRAAMECAGLEKVFTPVRMAQADASEASGESDAADEIAAIRAISPRIEPILALRTSDAPPERYGTQFASCAVRMRAFIARCGLRGVTFDAFSIADEAMLRQCVAPLCEDDGLVLHLQAQSAETVRALIEDFPALRLIVSLPDDEAALAAAGNRSNVLVRVRLAALERALALRGTNVIPYASAAEQPGELIGRWQGARAVIAQSLTQALLPLARTGFALQSADIESHVTALLGGNVLALYHQGGK